MSKVAWFLAATTLGLSVACAYLYRELQVERSRVEQVAAQSRAPARIEVERPDMPDPDAESELSAEVRPLDPPPRAPQGSAPSPESRAQIRAQQIAERQAESQRRWADPEWRARAQTRAESQVRQRNPDLGSVLHLNAEQETALVDLLARQMLQIQEASEPMRFANDAERQAMQQKVNALHTQHQQELSQYLGSGGYSAHEQYKRQVPERWQVRELRSRLDESAALTASQSTRLIDAMYQERDSYLQQMQSVEGYGGYGLQYPIVATSRNSDPVARARFAEEQLVRTEQFMGQLRSRAQQILSAEQLRRFDEIQEEQLAREQARVERMRNQAERRAMRRPPQQ